MKEDRILISLLKPHFWKVSESESEIIISGLNKTSSSLKMFGYAIAISNYVFQFTNSKVGTAGQCIKKIYCTAGVTRSSPLTSYLVSKSQKI